MAVQVSGDDLEKGAALNFFASVCIEFWVLWFIERFSMVLEDLLLLIATMKKLYSLTFNSFGQDSSYLHAYIMARHM